MMVSNANVTYLIAFLSVFVYLLFAKDNIVGPLPSVLLNVARHRALISLRLKLLMVT